MAPDNYFWSVGRQFFDRINYDNQTFLDQNKYSTIMDRQKVFYLPIDIQMDPKNPSKVCRFVFGIVKTKYVYRHSFYLNISTS